MKQCSSSGRINKANVASTHGLLNNVPVGTGTVRREPYKTSCSVMVALTADSKLWKEALSKVKQTN